MEATISIVFIIVLIAIALIDFRRGIIPNKIVYPAVLLALIIAVFSHLNALLPTLVTSFVLALMLAAAGIAQGKMGMGDVKLAFLIGLMTGFPSSLIAIGFGVILGGMAAVWFLVFKKKSVRDEMPYGPYLAAGAIIVILFNSSINAYVGHFLAMNL